MKLPRYNLVDEQGNRPVSWRSLRFLLAYTWPALRKSAWLLPDLKLPWFLLLWATLQSPKI